MKKEINLRTREFTITREFYWPRLLTTLAVIALLVLIVGGSIFAYLYQMRLSVENNYLTQEKTSLQNRVAPIIEMENKIAGLEKREKLAGLLLTDRAPWSEHFNTIRRIAGECGVRTTSLSNADMNRIRITGFSDSMRQISIFMQALADDEKSSSAAYKFMTLTKDSGFNYEIELVLKTGGDQ